MNLFLIIIFFFSLNVNSSLNWNNYLKEKKASSYLYLNINESSLKSTVQKPSYSDLLIYNKLLDKGKYGWQKDIVSEENCLPSLDSSIDNCEIFWAIKDKQKVKGFRKIKTISGCDGQCQEIIFYLVFDTNFKFSSILLDPKLPLTKIGHVPLTKKELDFLLAQANKIPSFFSSLHHPLLSTNKNHRTWSFHSPYLVEGAAYTSYRIIEAALKTQAPYRKKNNKNNKLINIIRGLNLALSNDELAPLYFQLYELSKSDKSVKKTSLTWFPLIFYWLVKDNKFNSKYTAPLRKFAEYKGSHLELICELSSDLSNNQSKYSANAFNKLVSTFPNIKKNCPRYEMNKYLTNYFLSKKSKLIEIDLQNISSSKILLLKKASEFNNHKSLTKLISDKLLISFPLLAKKNNAKNCKNFSDFEKVKIKVNELKLKKFIGFSDKIVVFVNSSCSSCIRLMKILDFQLGEYKHLSSIKFVNLNINNPIEKMCTKFKNLKCNQFKDIQISIETKKKLNLFSVPHISKFKDYNIIIPKVRLNHKEYKYISFDEIFKCL